MKSVGERECRVKYETEVCDRQAGLMGLVEGRQTEGLTFFEVCLGRPIRRNSVLDG